jgi:hypothetical protein
MQITVITEDIQNASEQLKSRGADMESAIQAADTAINPLRSFKSPRVERDLESWDNIKSAFKQSLETLIEAAQELARAAADNETANR